MSLGQLTSSALLYCPDEPSPTPTTPFPTFTTVWLFPAWAACPTSEWQAEWTITSVCTGDPATWTRPAIPPNFIKSVVTCDACEAKTQTITCPVDEAIQTGDVTINGNGVTATPPSVPAMATDAPGSGIDGGPGSGPPAPAAAPGAAPDSGSGSDTGAGGDSPAAAPPPAPNDNAGPGSAPDSDSGPPPPSPDSGSGAAPAPGGGGVAGSSPTLVTPQSNAGTDAASPPYATAGAPTLKGALLLVSGMFALVSGSLIYC